MKIERLLAHIATALKYPVLVLAIVVLVWVLIEVGGLIVELFQRRRRSLQRLEEMLAAAQAALGAGDMDAARVVVQSVALSADMAQVLDSVVLQVPAVDAGERIAKRLANYDYRQLRGLERTRILVRFGPALGLMGTLIPLSPALAGLARGDVTALSNNLQIAFSVTVTGLLVGAIAFAVSLVRDRLYGQDFSDVEYVAASLTAGAAQSTAHIAGTAQPTAVTEGTATPTGPAG